ncbi:MAG: hybrid sensor histidine kinase/response regulator [Phormidesmis sp.]
MSPQSAKILAVDDIPDNLFILDSILGDVDGYCLDCVNNGEAALSYLDSNQPDLILLDIMMPGLDGYEVTRRIRQSKAAPYIPILLVTAHDQSSLSEGLDSGADDFIRKPFDIDELMARVRSLLRLKRSLDEQQAMIRQRDDFVARLTHDLRTPLVAANRMLSLCLQGVFGEPPTDMVEAVENVVTNNENLLQMTNTLLQVYRHEAGQKKLVRLPLSIYSLAKEIVQELKPLAEEKALDLQLVAQQPADVSVPVQALASSRSAQSDLPTERSDETIAVSSLDSKETAKKIAQSYRTEGDRIELRRLLTNLLGNAIKFTDSGSISVLLSVSPAPPAGTESNQVIEVAIQDTGSGIEPEARDKIFEWFYQGDHMRAGSGLGLHLSKRIAEMHHGTLTLESEVGRGSTFTLVLPKL